MRGGVGGVANAKPRFPLDASGGYNNQFVLIFSFFLSVIFSLKTFVFISIQSASLISVMCVLLLNCSISSFPEIQTYI